MLCDLETFFASDASLAIDIAFLLSIGLSGSLHCVGMCGAISCSYAVPVSQKFPRQLWKYHFHYFLGRLMAYSWIGAFLGSLGMGMAHMTASLDRWENLGIWLAGIIMIVGGTASLAEKHWPRILNQRLMQMTDLLFTPIRSINLISGSYKAMPLGMLSGILPCGLMWAVEMRAFASQSIFWGMLTMALFCMITTPSVLLASTVLAKVSPHIRYRSTQLAGLLVIVMGFHLVVSHG